MKLQTKERDMNDFDDEDGFTVRRKFFIGPADYEIEDEIEIEIEDEGPLYDGDGA